MTRLNKAPRLLLASLCFFGVLGLWSSFAQQTSRPANEGAPTGRTTYNASCAGCHGLDGHGSDKAVNIAAGSEAQHLSDTELSTIIAGGMPEAGMPAFRDLSPKQIEEVVLYLRSLQGKGEPQTLTGDAQRGKGIFFDKGGCSGCHTVSGKGGFLGPDLSAYASTTSAKGIREEIVRSHRNPAPGYRGAVLTTLQGDRLEGLIRNEDNFSVQFQAKDGSFHFFQKSELRKFERVETSLMPINYGQRLSSQEVDDLVNFLISACPDAGKNPSPHKKEFEDE